MANVNGGKHVDNMTDAERTFEQRGQKMPKMRMTAERTDSHGGTSENGHDFLIKTFDVGEEWVACSSG